MGKRLSKLDRERRDAYRAWIDGIHEKLGMSGNRIAEKAEIAPSTVNRSLKNDDAAPPSWATIVKISSAIGVNYTPELRRLYKSVPIEAGDNDKAGGKDMGGGKLDPVSDAMLDELVNQYGAKAIITATYQKSLKIERQKKGA